MKSLTFKSRFIYLVQEINKKAGAEASYKFSIYAKLLTEEQMLAVVNYYTATEDVATIMHDIIGLAQQDEFFLPKITDLQ